MDLGWEVLASSKNKAAKAIREGKIEEALEQLELVNEQFRHVHDFAIDWISACYGKLAEAYGEDWLVKFNREILQ